jgi:hypothetical protein
MVWCLVKHRDNFTFYLLHKIVAFQQIEIVCSRGNILKNTVYLKDFSTERVKFTLSIKTSREKEHFLSDRVEDVKVMEIHFQRELRFGTSTRLCGRNFLSRHLYLPRIDLMFLLFITGSACGERPYECHPNGDN